MSRSSRTVSLVISLVGIFTHFCLALKLYFVCLSWKSEHESEWEGSSVSWSRDSLTLLWTLLSCYFAAAAASALVGFIGIYKNIPSCIRFCRDYSIGDLFFITISTISGAYVASTNPSFRTGLCEELSRQPDLLLNMFDIGVNLENCEVWFERAFLAGMAVAALVIVCRVHYVLAISRYYSYVSRLRPAPLAPLHSLNDDDSLHRIYLLSTPTSPMAPTSNRRDIFVYTPVLLSSLPEQQAKEMKVTEAWIPNPESPRAHRPSHRHSHSGRISLPIRPGEGLCGSEKAQS